MQGDNARGDKAECNTHKAELIRMGVGGGGSGVGGGGLWLQVHILRHRGDENRGG